MTVPDPSLATVVPMDAAAAYRAKLSARRGVLERELEAAPFHRVGTSWWEERTKEIRLIDQHLRG